MALRGSGLLLAILLHALLFLLLSNQRPDIEKERPARHSRLLIIALPPSRPPGMPADSAPIPAPRQRATPVARAAESPPLPDVAASADNGHAADIPGNTPAADPFDSPTKLDVDNLIKQAGKADREIRPAGENRIYGPASNSMEAVLNRAFTEAKLAVPPKWYEAARIESFTPPGARKPIYQVKTAFGTYCLFYPDRLTEGTGQPRIADCPRSSGR
jgi:hypothetical protein